MLEILLSTGSRKTLLPGEPLYVGMVPQANFITFANVAALTQMGMGTAINTSAQWLMFKLNGKEYYIPQKAIRTSFTWDELNRLSLVTGKNIPVGDRAFTVRLMTGATTNPGDTPGGEWNTFMYPIAASRPAGFTGTIQANLSKADLGIDETIDTQGRSNYCQESSLASGSTYCIRRGYQNGITDIGISTKSVANLNSGWRPILVEV